jgi:isopenicillin N synthase-like dioxygenase
MSTTMYTTTVLPQSDTGSISGTGAPEYAVISYAKLLSGETDEVTSLRQACERDGFFYLDLRQEVKQPHPIEQDVPSMFKVVNEFFTLNDEEKIQYDIDTIGPWKLHGYVVPPMPGNGALSMLIP